MIQLSLSVDTGKYLIQMEVIVMGHLQTSSWKYGNSLEINVFDKF